MKIYITILLLFIVGCNNNEAKNQNYLFYINEEDNLSINELTNKMSLPCGSKTTFPGENQLPNSPMSYFNLLENGINFDCEEGGLVYPIGPGVVVDVVEDRYEIKMFDHYQRLVEMVGYLPQDVRQKLYRTHVIIDHGKYFNNKYRTLAVYSNLTEIPEGLVLGSQIVYTGVPIGKIDNSRINFLATELEASPEDSVQYVVKDNTLNFELYFEKDGDTLFRIGQGIEQVEQNKFKEFFIDQ